MESVRLENVSKDIKGVRVLKNISYEFKNGIIYGLSGCNGSGKTMLLRMIAGLIRPTEGTVYIGDNILKKDIDYPPHIGVLIENPNFWEQYTGFEVLKMLANIKKEINNEEIRNAMLRVGLEPDDKRTVKKYSLGMKQKLGIAQAIMEKPTILLLDEPTNALDKKSIETVRNIMHEEAKRGAIVIIASHNVMDLDICDEILELEEGSIIS
ncbi:MAG: ABC transporter ATP-binding protein [Coprococcus sp.]